VECAQSSARKPNLEFHPETSMKTLRTLLLAVGFLTTVAVIPAAGAIYIKLDGIPGDVTTSGHENEIELLSVQFGVSQTGLREAGGKASARRSSLSTISISKYLDKSSPNLFLACATGQHINSAVLTFAQPVNGGFYEFLKITLTDVFISSYQVSSGGELPTESVSFSFSKIEYKYSPTTSPPITVTFDVLRNKEFTLAQ
jgi:type VI secretion system secreted protein Hcp